MFRIAVMVEDRKLADVLRSVAGQVHNLEVVPVVIGDAVAKVTVANQSRMKGHTKGTRRDISPSAFGFKKGQTFSYRDLVPLMTKMGMSEKSVWYCIMRMLKEKTVRRVGTGQYEVIA